MPWVPPRPGLPRRPSTSRLPRGPEDSPLTLEVWIRSTWLPMMRTQVTASTWSSYQRNVELHVVPRLGDVALEDLRPADLNRLYGELLESGHRTQPRGLSPKTVRYIHTIVHKALADAVDDGWLTSNPAERAKPPRPSRTSTAELRAWTPAQLRCFLAAVVDDDLATLWRLAAMTGMRRGELLGLRFSDVSFDASRLSVRHTIISVAYAITASTPKSHQARVIDLDPLTLDHLARHRDAGERTGGAGHGADAAALVFCRPDGSPLHPDSVSQRFDRLVAKLDVPRIRLHDLRHTHATIALQAGVPIKVISERLGHESPAFTMKQYAHALPGMQAQAARLVAGIVGADPSAPPGGEPSPASRSTWSSAVQPPDDAVGHA